MIRYLLKKILIVILVIVIIIIIVFFSVFLMTRGTNIDIIKPGTIKFSGPITMESYERLITTINESPQPIKWMYINSNGGNGLAGILIGRAIHKHQIKIYVPRKCVSTCANFVFPAGRKKVVGKNAIIIYHGGFHQDNTLDQLIALYTSNKKNNQNKSKEARFFIKKGNIENKKLQIKYFPEQKVCNVTTSRMKTPKTSAKECVDWYNKIETEYFDLIGIDPLTPYYGQRGLYKEIYKQYKYIGFYYDLDTLAHLLNADKIHVGYNNKWNPSENRSVKNEDVYKVEVTTNKEVIIEK